MTRDRFRLTPDRRHPGRLFIEYTPDRGRFFLSIQHEEAIVLATALADWIQRCQDTATTPASE